MSDKNSESAALAKHVEQFDEILRTFINETNKIENRFGITSDEEKKKLMFDSLLNYSFRGTTMSYDGFPIVFVVHHHRQGCNRPDSQKQED